MKHTERGWKNVKQQRTRKERGKGGDSGDERSEDAKL